MSRASRVLASASLGYFHMALTTIVGLWFTPFLLHHIGQRGFGLWAVCTPVLTYIGLVDFGVITILQRDVAFSLGAAGGDFRKAADLPILLGKTFRLVLWQMPIVAIVALAAWKLMPGTWQEIRLPFAVLLIAVVVCFPLHISHALLAGLQDLTFLAQLNLVNWMVGVLLSVVLVLLGWGLQALAVSWAIGQLTLGIVYYIRVRTRFPSTLPSRLSALSKAELAERLRKGFWVIVMQLSVMLLTGTDVVVIAWLRGPADVAPYTITDKLVTILANVPVHLLASAQPALSELRTSAHRERLPDICLALTQSVLLVSGIIATVILTVNHGFVAWWVGEAQFAGNMVTLSLVVGMLVSHWATAIIYTLFAFGYERYIAVTTVLTGLVTLGGTIVLTRLLGLSGAPLALILAFVLVCLPANLTAVARETGAGVWTSLVSLVPWAWRFALLAAGAVTLSRFWTPNTFIKLALASTVAALAYGLVMMPLALRDPLGPYVRPRIAAIRARLQRAS